MRAIRLPWFYRATAAALIPLQILTGPVTQALANDCANESSVHIPSERRLPSVPDSIRVAVPAPTPAKATLVPLKSEIRPAAEFRIAEKPSDAEITTCRIFLEPLVPIGGPGTEAENQKLANALRQFAKDPSPDSTEALEKYLAQNPRSPWRLGLLYNLSGLYRRGGYWSKALKALEEITEARKTNSDRRAQNILERGTSEYAELLARLGRTEELAKVIEGAGTREFHGSAAEKLAQAKGSLSLMRDYPERSFRCGPYAAGRVFTALNPSSPVPPVVDETNSTSKGTSLVQVKELTKQIGLKFQLARRAPGAELIVPSIIHWKEGHYAAIAGKCANGSYAVEDPTFTDNVGISARAINEEASGYFLVPEGALPAGWSAASEEESAKIWGKGAAPANGDPTPPCVNGFDINCQPCENPQVGMASYAIDPLRVNLRLSDTPIAYDLPRGGAMRFTVHYSHRDVAPSSTPSYSSLGPQWSFNWLAYVIDDPANQNTKTYGPGGGTLKYSGYNGTTTSFAPQQLSRVVLKRTSATTYEKSFPDGSRQIFGLADTSSPKRIFLTENYDAAGNKTVYNYDANFRITSVVDPLNQPINFTYLGNNLASPEEFYRIQSVSSLGRTATFAYDASNRLWKITDPIGIVSEFTYDGSGTFINALTTPYGTTSFTRRDAQVNANDRGMDITDPLGGKERVEYRYNDANAVPDNGAPVPANGISTLWQYRNSYYWDKKAYSEDPFDTSRARLYHWLHGEGGVGTVDILESYKEPLTRRVFFAYAGQDQRYNAGSSNQPISIGRVLDNGATELTQFAYNGLGRLTKVTTPSDGAVPARITTFKYATDDLDLLKVFQRRAGGGSLDPEAQNGEPNADLLVSYTYDSSSKRQPKTVTDTAGQTTTFSYNSYGQVLTATNAKGEVTTFTYDRDDDGDSVTDGYLRYIDDALPNTRTEFTYDGYGRLSTVKDRENAVTTYTHEAVGGVATATLNRVTKVLYPDGTSEEYTYDKLRLGSTKDTVGRITEYFHNALGQMEAVRDPAGNITKYRWCKCGSLAELTDPNNSVTKWNRDTMGRVTSKVFADGKKIQYAYVPATGQLASVADARNQVTSYQYRVDGLVSAVLHTNSAISTPNISFTYDTAYGYMASMMDGVGTTIYGHKPITAPPTLGAGDLETVDGPWANDTITYTYDELGRLSTRQVNGAANTFSRVYDTLGRITSVTTLQGTSNFAYIGTTGRMDYFDLPNSQRVDFDYYPLAQGGGNGSYRVKQIKNLNVGANGSGAILSKFDYTYNPVGQIVGWTQQQNGATRQWTAGYDGSDRLNHVVDVDALSVVQSDAHFRYDNGDNRTVEQFGSAPRGATHNSVNQRLTEVGGGTLAVAGSINESAKLLIAGLPVKPDVTGNFAASVPVNAGQNSIEISATDVSGNVTNRTVQVTVPTAVARNFGYDDNGNQASVTGYTAAGLTIADRTYEWDAENRLVSINYTGTTKKTKFTYDGTGRWVKLVEEDNGATTSEKRFVWDGLEIVEERDQNNAITRRYFGGGERRGSTDYFYSRDHLGNIREVTDASGDAKAVYRYDAWGRRSNVVETVEFDFGYTGHYTHRASGLVVAPFRFYDAEQGQWISRDPAAESGGLNLYGYVLGDPINYMDPDGQHPAAVGGFIGAVVGGVMGYKSGGRAGAIKGAIHGAIAGMVGGSMYGGVTGGLAGAGAGAIGAGLGEAAAQAFEMWMGWRCEWDPQAMAWSMVFGGIFGGVAGQYGGGYSPTGGRIFYVGTGAESLARGIASQSVGYKTIYGTWYGRVGQALDPFLRKISDPVRQKMWTVLSRVFANGAKQTDDVITVFGRHADTGIHTMKVNSQSAWRTTEYPTLEANGVPYRSILTP